MQRKRFNFLTHRAHGNILAEAVIIIPMLFLVIFACIELSWLMYVRHLMIDAAEDGARYAAVTSTATDTEVTATVLETLERLNTRVHSVCEAQNCVSVNPADIGGLARGEPITVTLTLPGSSISLLPNNQLFSAVGITLVVSASKIKEY